MAALRAKMCEMAMYSAAVILLKPERVAQMYGPGAQVTGSEAVLGISGGIEMERIEHTNTEDADEEDCVKEPRCIGKAVQAVEEARER